MSNLGPQFTVHTQHMGGKTKRKRFGDFDSAHDYAASVNPDVDGSMMPNVDDKLGNHPQYEKGMFWHGNRYAVITRRPPVAE